MTTEQQETLDKLLQRVDSLRDWNKQYPEDGEPVNEKTIQTTDTYLSKLYKLVCSLGYAWIEPAFITPTIDREVCIEWFNPRSDNSRKQALTVYIQDSHVEYSKCWAKSHSEFDYDFEDGEIEIDQEIRMDVYTWITDREESYI